MIFACNEHIELALDVAVDEWEVPPVVEKCETEEKCSYCEEKAVYTVAK
ncbi:CxxH/CxxC protein [Shouchella patagoniensis]|nr:CxxH/CxxC protein [Shouchella patagoniensis]